MPNNTSKHTGRGQLISRLAAQTGSLAKARTILKARGDMTPNGGLTAKGRARNSMTAAERAIDRTARSTGVSPKRLTYSAKTNRATVKKRDY